MNNWLRSVKQGKCAKPHNRPLLCPMIHGTRGKLGRLRLLTLLGRKEGVC